MGSVMFGANFQVAQNEIRKADVIVEHAKNFLDQYFTSIRRYVYPKILLFRTLKISLINLHENWEWGPFLCFEYIRFLCRSTSNVFFSFHAFLQIKFFIAASYKLNCMVQNKSPHLSIKFIGKRNHNLGYVMVKWKGKKPKRFYVPYNNPKLRFQCIEYTTSHMFWLRFHIQLANTICNI